MTKQDMKQVIYREFMRLVEPDKRYEIMPSGANMDRWDQACREVMYEMDRRSKGHRRRK